MVGEKDVRVGSMCLRATADCGRASLELVCDHVCDVDVRAVRIRLYPPASFVCL